MPGKFDLEDQVKSPKSYFRDTGLLHTLMGIKTLPELVTHPRAGASWEGFALEQVLRITQPDLADGIEAVPLWGLLPAAGDAQ